ncbi:hypothetical protein CHS0354_018489 [Potamilus streckersoni]|uniref:Uncharacterized protein n=1 Tax=Potamilus streckersoni TaxID=2493646 RepID=A0AAE0TAN6_9BIVA|nr:hypothetical protein CHS0354_018489 [Potamilus streckersoni]
MPVPDVQTDFDIRFNYALSLKQQGQTANALEIMLELDRTYPGRDNLIKEISDIYNVQNTLTAKEAHLRFLLAALPRMKEPDNMYIRLAELYYSDGAKNAGNPNGYYYAAVSALEGGDKVLTQKILDAAAQRGISDNRYSIIKARLAEPENEKNNSPGADYDNRILKPAWLHPVKTLNILSFITRYFTLPHRAERRYMVLSALLLTFWLPACNYDYYIANKQRESKNYEIANVHYHRALIDDPDDNDFIAGYTENSKTVSDLLLERYRRYIEERRFLPAYALLRRAQELPYNQEYIKEEEKNWLRVLIAGRVTFSFDTLNNYSVDSSRFQLQARFNTPNQSRRLIAPIDLIHGVYFTEDYLYKPQSEFLMFYTLNAIGLTHLIDIQGVENRIALKFEQSQNSPQDAGKPRYQKPTQLQNSLISEEFNAFIDFSFPVVSEASGELSYTQKLAQFTDYYPQDILKRSTAQTPWTGEAGIRFKASLERDRIAIDTAAKSIEFLPQIMYTNSTNNRVFLDFGELEVKMEKNTQLWKISRKVPEKPAYRDILMRNYIIRPYLISIDGTFPYVKGS